ncbi:hypothetical protein J6590_066704 [Homalodisca vitripennis]|nr:hypothetical protein J6590_066704 [Homalodisca vitripennis]
MLSNRPNLRRRIIRATTDLLARDARDKEYDKSGEDRTGNAGPFRPLNHIQRDDEDSPPQQDLTKVVGVSRHLPQT